MLPLEMKEILQNCHFVPMSTMKKVIELMETPQEFNPIDIYCKRNLFKLQQSKLICGKGSSYYDKKFKTTFRTACCRAIYSHNWNKLLYLLKKCPPWEHDWKDINEAALYVRNALGVPVAKAMMSEDGECVEWRYNVILDGPAEIWLLNLEHTMRVVLRDQLILTRAALRKCKYAREQWINDWPGQLGITCSKIQWTSDCTRTLARCDMMQEKKPLKKLRKKQNQILATLQTMSRKDIAKILRAKVNALCVIEIHSRDTVERMYKMGCMTVSTFEWFSQLKFYWDREREDCYIRQTNTNSIYTYEYIGNSGRLVITPLTDRCYITLTTALNLFRGGSPQGPAGTGKTETVKDLGRALARWVVVTNCSDGLDYKAMSKTFAGISQSGCWGCFDEFNRINIEVLSVVAQQILAVLLALSLFMKRFVFDGCDIKLDGNCGIFITMNPG